ncbi:MAG: hypothetical protein PHR28_05265 [candidate division Zixibacteria bacterium]|nr:hypothetical protein [candidate division Zixibacteria bacterium]
MSARVGYGVIIGLLVAANLLLLAHLWRNRDDPPRRSTDLSYYMKRVTLPDVIVTDSGGQSVRLLTLIENAAPALLVVFSPSDCPACLEERHVWSQVSRSGQASVIGIAASASADEFWKWAAGLKFDIPLFLDTCFALPDSMEFRVMPLKVLADRSGNIWWADPPRLDGNEMARFSNDLGRKIKAMP